MPDKYKAGLALLFSLNYDLNRVDSHHTWDNIDFKNKRISVKVKTP